MHLTNEMRMNEHLSYICLIHLSPLLRLGYKVLNLFTLGQNEEIFKC